jgi:hypothetical protein
MIDRDFVPFGLPIDTIKAINIFCILTKLEASQLLANEMRAALGWHTAD